MTDTDQIHDDEMFNEDTDRSSSEKTVYEELAEKEEALLLAAQFGKNLIEEKEELERQIESIKQEHQNELENYEQESFQLKRLIESIKNEYESKIYELNDDITILKKELKESQLSHLIGNTKYGVLNRDDEIELINELKERNSILVNQLNSSEIEITTLNQTINLLETKLDNTEKNISDNSKLLNSYQKEISKLMKKQQELEFALMQTYSEKDKQTKIMEEVTHKYLLLENDKNELEHLILQRDHEIYSLRQSNKNLLIKLERLESSTSPVVGDKRRSLSTLDSNMKKNASSNALATATTLNQVENTKPVETQSASRSREERKDNNEKVNNETSGIFSFGASTLLQSNPLRFSAGSNLDEDDREDDYDVDDGNYVDFVKSTQIEYDDDDEDDLFSAHHHALNPPAAFTAIYTNWQEESSTSENLTEQCVENKADTTTESGQESRGEQEALESKDAFKHQNGVQLVSRSCDEDNDLISFEEYHQSTAKECSL